MAVELAGTSDYFPSLLSKIHDAHPDIPIDNVILQAILLCIVAGRSPSDSPPLAGGIRSSGLNGSKYLLLRTREDDVNMVVNIVVTVSLIQLKCSPFFLIVPSTRFLLLCSLAVCAGRVANLCISSCALSHRMAHIATKINSNLV